MKAVVTWVFPFAASRLPGFQSAAQASAAKPRKPAKRKDKLSKAGVAFETFRPSCAIFNAIKQRKQCFGAQERCSCRPIEQKHSFRNAWWTRPQRPFIW
ncbi:hypothetical protein [Mesorhizobium sp. M2A.F.Ca.ET.043.05.1.1]|uniref:hypothetical protein n=1 Tax=Mesorhizobium sp. M2A.F.Ca.ET.043.05.1.1 TaxID=2493671 RepID=UPI00167B8279|nr:hypothetical protein [Mesorhizobium sp. M2A.F.Ca.ET.043.05.1.1]